MKRKIFNIVNSLSFYEIILIIIIIIVVYYVILDYFGVSLLEWITTPTVRNGAGSNFETRGRNIIEKMYNKKFPSARPYWLRNPKTGKNLEIDCYCHELRLGFEIDGIQHSQWVKAFQPTYQDFLDQIARDKYKDAMCVKNGVTLVRVPHWVESEPGGIEKFLKNELKRIGKLPC